MDKIIGMGNALVDVLVKIDDDSLLGKLHLPKGSMQLIQEATLSEIRKYTSGMKIHRSTGGSAGNTVCALAALGANPGFIGKVGQDETGAFFGDTLRQCGVNALLAPAICRRALRRLSFLPMESVRSVLIWEQLPH